MRLISNNPSAPSPSCFLLPLTFYFVRFCLFAVQLVKSPGASFRTWGTSLVSTANQHVVMSPVAKKRSVILGMIFAAIINVHVGFLGAVCTIIVNAAVFAVVVAVIIIVFVAFCIFLSLLCPPVSFFSLSLYHLSNRVPSSSPGNKDQYRMQQKLKIRLCLCRANLFWQHKAHRLFTLHA